MMQLLFAPHIACRGTLGGNHQTIFGTQLAVHAHQRVTPMHAHQTLLTIALYEYVLC
jgi:hypothetical protein